LAHSVPESLFDFDPHYIQSTQREIIADIICEFNRQNNPFLGRWFDHRHSIWRNEVYSLIVFFSRVQGVFFEFWTFRLLARALIAPLFSTWLSLWSHPWLILGI
jgi:hypothetical protein